LRAPSKNEPINEPVPPQRVPSNKAGQVHDFEERQLAKATLAECTHEVGPPLLSGRDEQGKASKLVKNVIEQRVGQRVYHSVGDSRLGVPPIPRAEREEIFGTVS
jgi:hypothetical protein